MAKAAPGNWARPKEAGNDMSMLRTLTIALAAATGLAGAASAQALDEVSFGTNWLAQAEHGGFYQAVADGTYEKHGLKVTIVQGGPQASNQALLMADKIQFYVSGNLILPFSAAEQDIPLVEVAAIFQKDPQIFMTHPDAPVEKFEDLAKLPTIFMGNEVFVTMFQWMKSEFPGFRDEQMKPYTFNPAPFIADPQSAQQGYATSEPFAVEQAAGWKPKVFLAADAGFNTYSTMIEAKTDFVAANKDLVQRFVDASIIGWYNYLYGDNAAANELIKKDNPEMTDDQIAFSIQTMKDSGLLESAEALEQGIGCMTDARVKDFYDKMVAAGVVKADLDVTTIYTTEFVCKKVGMDLKK
jgi:NitT/TauT family transport system substrate-binding protein